jgi:phosphoribosyl 1,2-cyclic phosphodiesterase
MLLECNHDEEMLHNGPYPFQLKRRVASDYGHLNNAQAAQLLTELERSRLKNLVLGHLSETNNKPELAKEAVLETAPDLADRLHVLEQGCASPWFLV